MLLLLIGMATAPVLQAQSQPQAGDELLIQQVQDTTWGTAVQMQQKIIVWTADKGHRKGRVTALDSDTLALDSVTIPIAAVTKIRAYSKAIGTQRMNAWARRSAWVALAGLGLLVVGGGIALLLRQVLVAIVLAALGGSVMVVSLFILAGTIVAQIGANIPATTFKLKRGWQLKVLKAKKR
jgi:hypothetical protein